MSFFESVENLNRKHSLVGDQPIFSNDLFPWVAKVEANTKAIKEELQNVLIEKNRIPNFQDVLNEEMLAKGDNWKSYFLYISGTSIKKNCQECPITARTLKKIPGMRTAFFSILKPHVHLSAHRGPFNGVLRYHLGLIIPKNQERCFIRVSQSIAVWKEGESLIFDDSYNHEVWNNTAEERVVLFVDFLRPLPTIVSLFNRLMLFLSGHYLKEIRDAKKYLKKHN